MDLQDRHQEIRALRARLIDDVLLQSNTYNNTLSSMHTSKGEPETAATTARLSISDSSVSVRVDCVCLGG